MLSRLGRFEIQAEIGRGGFGQVFRAFDPVMNRVVALKVLAATEDAGSFNRFKAEATAAGNLHHENIVTVYEFGQEGATPFLVMEYLSGEDLQHLIQKQTPLSLYQKIRIMDQVADGLHCAHRNGVLHRDVKPANVMVLTDGAVKIMDFGIARLMRDTSTRLTQQGYLIGTVAYMAPELFAGHEMDSLCDIWAYGVITYELLTGKNPFQTGNMQSEMYRIVNQDPTPLPPDQYPAELQAVVSKLLARQREYRYQTLEDTRFDLQPILKNLEKAEAARLISIAQQSMSQQQWSEARDAAREARKMDPLNGTARIVFEKVQTELQRQTVLPRLDERVRQSTKAAEQRNLSAAIEHLEAARKLDTTNEELISRLQSLRESKTRVDEAIRLLTEADKDFREQRLTDAHEHASQAISLDPNNREARNLLETLHGVIQDREAEGALEADMQRARGQMAVDDLDGAMETLKGAESRYPGRAAVNDLLAKVADLIGQRERRRDFSCWLEKTKDLVRQGRFDQAVRELEQLLESFPNEVEATGLLSYARQELKAKQRSDVIKPILEAAANLMRDNRCAEAMQILEQAVARYPEELGASRQLRTLESDLRASKRGRSLQTSISECEYLRSQGHLQSALARLATLLAEFPNNSELLRLQGSVEQQIARAEPATEDPDAVEPTRSFRSKLQEIPDQRPPLENSSIPLAVPVPAPQAEQPPSPSPATRTPEMPADTIDRVHFTVTSPPCVQPGDTFELYVWAHLEQQRKKMIQRARLEHGPGPLNIKSKGPVHIGRGTTVTVYLSVDEMTVPDPEDTILWEGEVGNAIFLVKVPANATLGPYSGMATLCVNGCRIARLHFTLRVGQFTFSSAQLKTDEDRPRRAFTSYATEDQREVLARVQGIQKAAPRMEFVDVPALRSGQHWEQDIRRIIPGCDVFYLFWSGHARDSRWVDGEWRCAFREKGLDFIDPIPLVPASVAPPPPELAAKGFADPLPSFLKYAPMRQSVAVSDLPRTPNPWDPGETALLAPGNRYEIIRELGRGGMGIVYLALDSTLNRQVAIKRLLPPPKDPDKATVWGDLVRRFTREARVAALLNHPNLVGIYDVVSEPDSTFIVMEFVSGRTLTRAVPVGTAATAPFVVKVLRQCASALDHAHSRGVVHRDIKPDNILLDGTDLVKIADFGIAKVLNSTTDLTHGYAIGTLEYMSPEQLQGGPVDRASDQYSLAVVAYQILTGSRIFDADTFGAWCEMILHQLPVPASTRNTSLPCAVDAILARAMDKAPIGRYHTCGQFAEELENALLSFRRI